jgi:hypothetical protein
LLASAALIWAIVEVWPLLLLVGELAIATKKAKRHREVFKGSTIAASVLLFAVLVVHAIVNPTPTAPVAAASPPPSVASTAPFAPLGDRPGMAPPSTVAPPPQLVRDRVTVSKVIDGDTFPAR